MKDFITSWLQLFAQSLLNIEALSDTLMNYVLNTLPNCQGEFCTNVVAYFAFGILVLWHENPILIEIA